MSSVTSKSMKRRMKEKEGPPLISLPLEAVMYCVKQLQKFMIASTKKGGDMHANMDWSYEGLRRRMCEIACIDVQKTSNSNTASQVRNKMGKTGMHPTALKHYGMASRKSNEDGKCTFSPLAVFITYPGPEWCDLSWYCRSTSVAIAVDPCINAAAANFFTSHPPQGLHHQSPEEVWH